MLAALLQAAGVWLGDHVYEPINEDAEITQILRARDLGRLDALIDRQHRSGPSGASRCRTCISSCSTMNWPGSATRIC
ncbi:MAG: hypothetical protein WDN25_19750 [Acetobacteraceae bacterium]